LRSGKTSLVPLISPSQPQAPDRPQVIDADAKLVDDYETENTRTPVFTWKIASAIVFGMLVGWGLTIVSFQSTITAFANELLFFFFAGFVLGNQFCLWCFSNDLDSQRIYLRLKFKKKK